MARWPLQALTSADAPPVQLCRGHPLSGSPPLASAHIRHRQEGEHEPGPRPLASALAMGSGMLPPYS